MRFRSLTTSTALLLTATALSAQEAETSLENVYVDVDGTAVQVSVALAAEACGQDEAAIQQLALTRIEESGLDPAMQQEEGSAADAAGTATADTGADLTSALDTAEATGADTATVEADVPSPDASNETVTTAQGTADPTTSAPGEEMLALAVCQIDTQTAAQIGIPTQGNEIVTD